MQLKIDTHVHSRHSADSTLAPEHIFDRCEELGLDGVSITDHNFFDPELFRYWQTRTELILIPGQEISTRQGHLLAYFIEEPVSPVAPAKEAVDAIHEQNGLAVLAHPYRSAHSYTNQFCKRLDAVELFNARSGDPGVSWTPNHKAQMTFSDHELPKIAGSDAHLSREIGRGVTTIDSAPELSAIQEKISDGVTETEGLASAWGLRSLSYFTAARKERSLKRFLKLPVHTCRWLGRDLREALAGE